MKIRYSLTWKEYRRSSAWRWSLVTPKDKLQCVGIISFLLVLNALGLFIDAHRDPYFVRIMLPIEARFMLTWMVVGALAYLPLTWLLEMLGRSIQIDQDGVVFTRYIEPIRLQWQRITVLDEDAQAIYMAFNYQPFRFARTQPVPVFIPKRAFPTTGEAERFYHQAQQYCGEAGGRPNASVYAGRSLPAH